MRHLLQLIFLMRLRAAPVAATSRYLRQGCILTPTVQRSRHRLIAAMLERIYVAQPRTLCIARTAIQDLWRMVLLVRFVECAFTLPVWDGSMQDSTRLQKVAVTQDQTSSLTRSQIQVCSLDLGSDDRSLNNGCHAREAISLWRLLRLIRLTLCRLLVRASRDGTHQLVRRHVARQTQPQHSAL